MKILFTCVGRRVELIQAFKSAANKCGIYLEIYGADATSTAPALFFCDQKLITPRIQESDYISSLQEFCKEESIDALVPTIDSDLLLLSENREKFGNTKVIISSPEKVLICRNKEFTADYFNSIGLKSPYSVDNYRVYNAKYPAFIKPKDGSSSINAHKVNTPEELKTYSEQVPNYIIQSFIEGTEYTVDAFCDFEGNPVYITPRIRLAVRAGEVLKTEISQDCKIISEIKSLLSDFKPCGQITIQLIREKDTSDDYFIEINPRFGGGSPLSIKAGADSAEALIRLLSGEKLNYIEKAAEDGVIYSRFDQSIRVN